MSDELYAKLQQIYQLVLDYPDHADMSKVRRISDERWDSLANVTLVTALESEFGVVMDVVDVERLTSFSATLLILQEKLG